MPFTVLLTHDGARDLDELYDYIALQDAPRKADCVLEQIEKTFSQLSEFPERGAYPRELLAIGIRDYREVFFKPYRIIYRVEAWSTCREPLATQDPEFFDLSERPTTLLLGLG